MRTPSGALASRPNLLLIRAVRFCQVRESQSQNARASWSDCSVALNCTSRAGPQMCRALLNDADGTILQRGEWSSGTALHWCSASPGFKPAQPFDGHRRIIGYVILIVSGSTPEIPLLVCTRAFWTSQRSEPPIRKRAARARRRGGAAVGAEAEHTTAAEASG